MKKDRLKVVKAIFFLTLLGMGLIFHQRGWDDYLTPPLVRKFLVSYGSLAPAVYLFLFTLRPLVLVPSSLLAVVGGVLFGPLWGTVYTVLGSLMGAELAYWVGRHLGRDFVTGLLPGKLEKLEQELQSGDWQVILLLRLTPFLAADAISYGAGLLGVRPGPFLLGTLLGVIPGSFLFVWLGESFRDPFSPVTIILVAVYLLFSGFFWWRRRQGGSPPDST